MPIKVEYEDNFLMSPKNDFAFKRVFGDERNKDILIAFLNAVLKMPDDELEGIEFINTELKKEYIEDRKAILDVMVKTKKGVHIDIEIQVIETSYMAERTLHYWAKMYNEQIKTGDDYETLNKAIAINIVDFNCLRGKKYYSVFHVTEDETGEILTDVLEIYFLELKKLPQVNANINNPLVQWLMFIDAKSKEVLDMLAEKNTHIEKAYEVLKVLSQDDEARAMYAAREKAIRDELTRVNSAYKKGVDEGEKKGKYGVAKNLLRKDMDSTFVAEVSGLSLEEVMELMKQEI